MLSNSGDGGDQGPPKVETSGRVISTLDGFGFQGTRSARWESSAQAAVCGEER